MLEVKLKSTITITKGNSTTLLFSATSKVIDYTQCTIKYQIDTYRGDTIKSGVGKYDKDSKSIRVHLRPNDTLSLPTSTDDTPHIFTLMISNPKLEYRRELHWGIVLSQNMIKSTY